MTWTWRQGKGPSRVLASAGFAPHPPYRMHSRRIPAAGPRRLGCQCAAGLVVPSMTGHALDHRRARVRHLRRQVLVDGGHDLYHRARRLLLLLGIIIPLVVGDMTEQTPLPQSIAEHAIHRREELIGGQVLEELNVLEHLTGGI